MNVNNPYPIMQPSTADEIILQAAGIQAQTTEQLHTLVGRMAEIVVAMDTRLKSLEGMLGQRVTVSSIQAKGIADAVRNRAADICSRNGLRYPIVGRHLRDAIWRAFRSEYRIQSHYDLPAIYYENAITYINGWTSYAMIRRMREKEQAHEQR